MDVDLIPNCQSKSLDLASDGTGSGRELRGEGMPGGRKSCDEEVEDGALLTDSGVHTR